MKTTTLQQQIDSKRREIQTEGYPMSVGELVNLYRDQELDIHPEFQRFFRWTPAQKSRFIESLLLGIPIPSLFVYQRQDGVWDVIDGLQRLSTIFEFMGILRNHDDSVVEASRLVATDYLPGLSGMKWDSDDEGLTGEQQRLIKRAALDLKIVRRESDDRSKYDLFERLNTGGSQLTDQEVRNCLMIMKDPEYYRWILSMRENADFSSTISLSERSVSEQYDMELVLRFLMIKDLPEVDLGSLGDMSDFLNRSVLEQAEAGTYGASTDLDQFAKTFKVINEALEDSAFRRYDQSKGRFLGGFSVAAFEAVTVGVYSNLSAWEAISPGNRTTKLASAVEALWSESDFRDNSGSGFRASQRVAKIVPFAKEHFRP